jgi:hypothetical protein
MARIADIERKRQSRQERLDALKSAAERNRLGQFATPAVLAEDIARYAVELHSGKRERITFLDPAIGTGSFYSALLNSVRRDRVARGFGVEVDGAFAQAARDLWGERGLSVESADFTALRPPEPHMRFNLLLTNPPYVRHHHLESGDKARLRQLVLRRRGIHLSGLSGLYCYFLLLSHDWLAEGALSVWLVPSEFMDVNYGRGVKEYLRAHVDLIRVHRFNPDDVQFADALVSSAVVVFRNAPPNAQPVEFTYGGTLSAPQESRLVARECLGVNDKWNALGNGKGGIRTENATLGDLFAIKRGLATGSNRFFIISESDARQLGIPDECVKPVFPGPRHLKQDVVEADRCGYPVLPDRRVMIDCAEPERTVKTKWPQFWRYLEGGREAGIDEGYLASRRQPWYSQERREPAPFLCTYMGRQIDGRQTFRFIWNKSRAVATNVYLCLYPKGALRQALNDGRTSHERVFEALTRLEMNEQLHNGRVYGGGLFKMEPMELARIDAGPLALLVGPRATTPLLFDLQ